MEFGLRQELQRRPKYVVRYFVLWPPPHPKLKRREDKAAWYWNGVRRQWTDRAHATPYKTRAEAEDAAFLAASAITQRSPNGEQVGSVRTSRLMVNVVELH